MNTTLSSLNCQFCGKLLKNDNAHSGHMIRCTKRLEQIQLFKSGITPLLADPVLSASKWNAGDHSYLIMNQYPELFSDEALKFIRKEVSAMEELSDERLQKYCIFYLTVIAQIAAFKEIRKQAFELLHTLISENEMRILLAEWPKLGSTQYSPCSEGYEQKWARLIRIKEKVFFNVDYPVWIVLLDRYVLTYPDFGWSCNDVREEYFRDLVLATYQYLLLIHQDAVDVNPKFRHIKIPTFTLKYLNPMSQRRYDRENITWVKSENMPYDPRDPATALII
jgi:hypothetical protein